MAVVGEPVLLVVDPAVAFGQVCVASTRVPARAVAERVLAGDPVAAVADDFGLGRDHVVLACWFEVAEASARPRTYRTAWERQLVVAWGDWYQALPWPIDLSVAPDPAHREGERA